MRSTSKPRAATSVATTTSTWPRLSLLIVRSLMAWLKSPFNAAEENPLAWRRSEISTVEDLVRTKIIMPSNFSTSRTRVSASIFWCAFTVIYCCLIRSTVCVLFLIRTCWASPRYLSATRFIAAGIVAENSARWLSSGVFDKIASTSSIKPMRSISSASSNTKDFTWLRLRLLRFRWSSIRPGVPTTTCAPRFRLRNWPPISAPP